MSDYICPYTCSYRTNSGFCGHTGGWERCQYRQLRQPNTVVGYVPSLIKTNSDRIRSMTDEELADKLEEIQLKTVKAYGNGDLLLKGELKKYWLDWLKEGTDHD